MRLISNEELMFVAGGSDEDDIQRVEIVGNRMSAEEAAAYDMELGYPSIIRRRTPDENSAISYLTAFGGFAAGSIVTGGCMFGAAVVSDGLLIPVAMKPCTLAGTVTGIAVGAAINNAVREP
jgi:hypothetical protein